MLGRAMALPVAIAALYAGAIGSVPPLTAAQDPPLQALSGPRPLFDQFADRLDLDGRTQKPEAEKIFTAATTEALPVAQQLNQLRIRLVNAEIEGNAAEVQTILAEHTVVAARLAEMEAAAFAQVYALLTPGQHKRAPDAFRIISGIFVPSATAAPARGGARGARGGQ